MPLPLKILNRLRLGREVAARVTPSRPDHLAWVYVYPMLDPQNGVVVKPARMGAEPRFAALGEGNPIIGFLVCHLEIEAAVAEEVYKGIRDDLEDPAFDHPDLAIVANEEELAVLLQRWVTDPMTLHVPMDVGYRFNKGPTLLRKLGAI